ncbi:MULTISPECIES: hypothetical protein [unclassified Colwellia]|jgi:hypothetical protein|uniref:hypothetical protein n=1 Tax=unclassified Colwellia TaxID=196834 RepID=UPI0015F3DC7E|nr:MULTISPECIES: hypothetical protein [unclassified Colwellia]MBA6233641.1 hypothetical protein [Colwellia sp. MB02u-7]MBA6237297.1 hypothetical protein [Colwellia sp. MB02u-11]MBA6257296.1 hypothetical protein [Colwellia sp. MB3u-28]MBA6258880.1 hypothetical protein [Colwellia sp. MB3u-41]MBA6300542.1 hypothetical protein [Colwellia sp. MB3u-22]
MKEIIITIASLMIINSVSAAEYFRERTIVGAGVYYSGTKSILFVDIDGDKSTMSSCATTKRFAIDSNTPNFKEMVSIVMTAYATGEESVDLIVNTTCNHWGNAQDLLGIKIGKMPW